MKTQWPAWLLVLSLQPLAFSLALAQMQQMFLNSPPKAAVAAWSPAQLPNVIWWISSQDMPKNSTTYNWTNKIAGYTSIVMTNSGVSTTNSSNGKGVYFAGSALEVFTNNNSGIPWTNGLSTAYFSSMWLRMTVASYIAGTYRVILGNDYTSRSGFYANGNTTPAGLFLYNGAYSGVASGWPTATNTQYDIFLIGTNSASVAAIIYTNGVFMENCTVAQGTKGNVWGLGRSAYSSDTYANFWLQDCAVSTNYSFTAADMANIAAYPY